MHVYAIEAPNGLVKVGRSNNPSSRINAIQLQGGFSSVNCWVSVKVNNASAVEQCVHADLQQSRKIGEWFSVDFNAAVTAICNAVEINKGNQKPPATAKSEFADRLNSACENVGIAKKDRRSFLSNNLGVSGEAARLWLTGKAIPAMTHLVYLSTELNASPDWLLTGVDLEKQNSEANTILATLSDTNRQQALRMLRAFAASCA